MMNHFQTLTLAPTDKDLEEVAKFVDFLDDIITLAGVDEGIDVDLPSNKIIVRTSNGTLEELTAIDIQSFRNVSAILEGVFY